MTVAETIKEIVVLIMGLVIGFGPIILVIVLMTVMRRRKLARYKVWKAWSARRGFEWHKPGKRSQPSVTGIYKNFHVRLYGYVAGRGDNATLMSVVNVHLPVQNRTDLRVFRETFGTRLGTKLGLADVQIGDPAFDETWIVRCDDEAYARAILDPQLRGMFMTAKDVLSVAVSGGKVIFTETGIIGSEQFLDWAVEALTTVAYKVVSVEAPHLLEQAAPPQQAVPHAPPTALCDNCVAPVDWTSSGKKGTATCAYCGNRMQLQF